MPIQFGGPGVSPSFGQLVSNYVELEAGQCWLVPSGRWSIKPGPYTSFQVYDPITTIWKTIGAGSNAAPNETVFSDGFNYRLANQTGCVVGASLTNVGSGYTSAPVPALSAGSAIAKCIVGGAISATVTVTNGGSNYTYPPLVQISLPPSPGVPAVAYCTLSAGAVSTVTVIDQGAGYTSPPTVSFVNDPREVTPASTSVTLGSGAAATTSLTGAQTVTAIVVQDHGSPVSQATVPTISFTGGGGSSVAATALMCWTVTTLGVSTTTFGSGYASPVIVSGYDVPTVQSTVLNPSIASQLVKERQAFIVANISGAGITGTGASIKDGGVYVGLPTFYTYGFIQGAGAVQVVFTGSTMGGVTDISTIQPT